MRRYFRLFRRLFALLRNESDSPARIYVRRGDAARTRRDWPAAAAAYRAAVEEQPDLFHIWIQLGHALKEAEILDQALDAYRRAAALRPDLSEAFIFLAHVCKRLGRREDAVRALLQALAAGERSQSESDELLVLLATLGEHGRDRLLAMLREELAALPRGKTEVPLLTELRRIVIEELAPTDDEASSGPALVFDISDLIAYYNRARLPTGIQRVQIETIQGALSEGDGRDIRLCCFIDGRDEWLELPMARMQAIVKLSTSGGDPAEPAWVEAVAGLRLFLSLTVPFEFPHGAALVNLGTSWWLQNYFLFVRHAKLTHGIRYIPFVHDMIPVMAPEHCVRGLTQDFISWVIGVFDLADHFLVNSEATKKDLLAVAETLGHIVDPDNVAVVPLDADFRREGQTALPDRDLDRWKLQPGRFVLFVSTIESRKGHLIAFDAWADLVQRLGADAVPDLVCVGNRGWLNDRVYDRAANDPVIAAKVKMLTRLADEELSLLYRTCLFTIYPSLYEGWGLPVTESLCHGKVPLISDAASLPEAGGAFALYVEAGSSRALADGAERLIVDADHRRAAEAHILAGFRARGWKDLARQIGRELDSFASRGAAVVMPHPPAARIGRWHGIGRNGSTRIWRGMRTGESFRANLGWSWPEERGCRIHHDGADLQIPISEAHGPLRMLFKLVGDDHREALWSARAGDAQMDGLIEARVEKWITFELPASPVPHALHVRFKAGRGEDGAAVTYFVAGFFLHETDDQASRQNFVEAVALQRLDAIDAFGDA